MTEEELVGWHHRPVDMSLSKLQELVMDRDEGSLAWCSPWGCKESDTTEPLN